MMFFGVVAFVVGIAVLQWFVVLPDLLLVCCVVVILFLALCFRNFMVRRIVFLLFSFLLGFAWAVYRANGLMLTSLSAQDIGKRVTATGWVASIPKKMALGMQFQFRLKELNNKKQSVEP